MEFDYKKPRTNNEIKSLRARVSESDWPEAKKNAFFNFQDFLIATDKSERTQTLYSISIHQLGSFEPRKEFFEYSEGDLMKFKTQLMKEYSPYTIHNRMLDVITFLKWHLKLKIKPECMDWYNVSEQGKKARKKHNPLEVLSEEDIRKIVACAGSRRNKAIAFALFETGCRIEEFLNVRIEDLVFDDKIVSIYINKGKTKESERPVYLINSAITLKDWLEEHPFKHNPKAFLFCSIGKGKTPTGNRLYCNYANCILRRAAAKAKITKPANAHAFRRARATDLDRKRHSKRLVEQLLGWSPNSRMHSFYSQISAEDVKKGLMEDAGIITKEQKRNELKPIECPFCKTENTPEALICRNMTCLRPISEQGIIQEKKKKEDLMKDIIRGEFKILQNEMDKERENKTIQTGGIQA